ncbi:hypothetical protein AMECASPLE_012796 [Ameca splendens]|uniref:Uncharacterized protein n=1 Tax=Ameca splendens TaxID=208324 RepID=A0ABV0YN91_9TELE
MNRIGDKGATLAESNPHRKRVRLDAGNADQALTPVIQGPNSLYLSPKSQLLQLRIRLSRSLPSAATPNTLHPTPLAPPTCGEPIGRGTHVSSYGCAGLCG